MRSLDEKKMLVKMARLLGQPVDQALVESIEREEKLASAISQNQQKSAAGPSNVQVGPGARRNFITQNYDSSNSEIYVLIATNLGALSTNVFAGFSWREVF